MKKYLASTDGTWDVSITTLNRSQEFLSDGYVLFFFTLSFSLFFSFYLLDRVSLALSSELQLYINPLFIHPPSLPCTHDEPEDEPWMLCGSFRLISSRSILFCPVPGRASPTCVNIWLKHVKTIPGPVYSEESFQWASRNFISRQKMPNDFTLRKFGDITPSIYSKRVDSRFVEHLSPEISDWKLLWIAKWCETMLLPE